MTAVWPPQAIHDGVPNVFGNACDPDLHVDGHESTCAREHTVKIRMPPCCSPMRAADDQNWLAEILPFNWNWCLASCSAHAQSRSPSVFFFSKRSNGGTRQPAKHNIHPRQILFVHLHRNKLQVWQPCQNTCDGLAGQCSFYHIRSVGVTLDAAWKWCAEAKSYDCQDWPRTTYPNTLDFAVRFLRHFDDTPCWSDFPYELWFLNIFFAQ